MLPAVSDTDFITIVNYIGFFFCCYYFVLKFNYAVTGQFYNTCL